VLLCTLQHAALQYCGLCRILSACINYLSN
jgi:hypothetical protein